MERDVVKDNPFGNPDGSAGPFEGQHDFVLLRPQFGPATRPAAEHTRVRAVAGAQGVGKTLFLRRLQAHYRDDPSVYSTPPTLKGRELDTETVVEFSQFFTRSTNTEAWTVLWDRAIHLSAATHIVHDAATFGDVPAELRAQLQTYVLEHFPKSRSPRNPVEVAGHLTRGLDGRETFRRDILNADDWHELAHSVQASLAVSRELYLFVDAIDDNYRYAPTYWQQCQRGLFHAVMDTQRTEVESSKLHVVISIRDLTLSSIARSEHATRYVNNESIVSLEWSWGACQEFLNRKLELLPAEYFPGRSRTLGEFAGREFVHNSVRDMQEPIDQYFLRHTRLSPRDIISTGNALAELATRLGTHLWQVSDGEIRSEIARSAAGYAKSALAQAGNQVLSNVMPWSASRMNYADFYVSSDEYTADAMVREMCSVLLRVEAERFDVSGRMDLEDEAEARFGAKCHFVDVLWQNRLLGAVSKTGEARFYKGAFHDEVGVPDASQYVLNSLLIDLLPGLALNSAVPVYPGGYPSD
jgi:hypothetical protein